jgi:hypothetical protein
MKHKKLKFDKIEFAPTFEIEQSQDLVDSFLYKIFGIEHALVTDESSIYDFDFEFTGEKIKHHTKEVLEKIKKVYEIDVSDVKGLNLAEILQRIRIIKNI